MLWVNLVRVTTFTFFMQSESLDDAPQPSIADALQPELQAPLVTSVRFKVKRWAKTIVALHWHLRRFPVLWPRLPRVHLCLNLLVVTVGLMGSWLTITDRT